MKITLKFEPRDLWVGVFWKTTTGWANGGLGRDTSYIYFWIYICLIPCVPILITWHKVKKWKEEKK